MRYGVVKSGQIEVRGPLKTIIEQFLTLFLEGKIGYLPFFYEENRIPRFRQFIAKHRLQLHFLPFRVQASCK